MQTFPPLCIYNFGLPRRTPSPRTPPPHAISLRGCSLVTWMAYVTSLCLHDDAPNWRRRDHGDSRASTSDDVRGHVWTTYAATTQERKWTFPRGDLGWAATGIDLAWAATGTHNVRQNGAKGKKTRGRDQ